MQRQGYFIVHEEMKLQLMNQIRHDVAFFTDNNIIDYSLLIGVHKLRQGQGMGSSFSDASRFNEKQRPFFENDQGGLFNAEEREIYFLGIIDFFTVYGTKKKLEHLFKSLKYTPSTISCVPSGQYGEWFIKFMNERFMSPYEQDNFRRNTIPMEMREYGEEEEEESKREIRF